MTLNEFFEALEKVPGEWVIDDHDGWIRICDKSRTFCPIEAVAADKGSLHTYQSWGQMKASGALGISPGSAARVMTAADNHGAPQTRARLLKACKLTEKP